MPSLVGAPAQGSRNRGEIALLWSLILLVGGLLATRAEAVERYADTEGNGLEPCLQANPCDIQTAVEDAGNTDEVIILPGNYGIGTDPLVVQGTSDVHGDLGQPRPQIFANLDAAGAAVDVGNGKLRHVSVTNTTSNANAVRLAGGATVERVIASSVATACSLEAGNATIRDSFCHSSAVYGVIIPPVATGNVTGTLRNVTATTASPAIALGVAVYSDGTELMVIDAKNVIATGTFYDVQAYAADTSTALVNLDYSNYNTILEDGTGGSVTDPGTLHNQMATPLLGGDGFHQLGCSPTIDAGTSDLLGATDIDGEARTQGPAPDIGADETLFDCPAPPPEPGPEGGTAPPDTIITSGPSGKTKSKSATFVFNGTDRRAIASFQCKLDAAAFVPCSSPYTVKVRKGKHTFQVQAIDQAGNVDPTPATDNWRVKKKTKK